MGEKNKISHSMGVKKTFKKKPIVKVFESQKEIVLTTDANKLAVSDILLQDGYPFMY